MVRSDAGAAHAAIIQAMKRHDASFTLLLPSALAPEDTPEHEMTLNLLRVRLRATPRHLHYLKTVPIFESAQPAAAAAAVLTLLHDAPRDRQRKFGRHHGRVLQAPFPDVWCVLCGGSSTATSTRRRSSEAPAWRRIANRPQVRQPLATAELIATARAAVAP